MSQDNTPLYPLQFAPIYKEKVWGGRAFEKLDRNLPGEADAQFGESWELVDLGQTSVSGGGGSAERSTVINGPLAGHTLNALIAQYGDTLMGTLPSNDGEFPLLVKFLDARQNLSVQVHPSADYAASHEDAFLKSEAWYIVDCEPGAVIYKGIDEGVTPELFRKALEENSADAVEPLMLTIPVKPGDCHYLPSGTCHALGAGILVAEVQTPSDTTFRVFDWGRVGRELHVEPALACIHFGPANVAANEKRSVIRNDEATLSKLVECEFFRMERIEHRGQIPLDLAIDQPTIWMILDGSGTFTCEGLGDSDNDSETVFTFKRGQTCLLPARMTPTRVMFDQPTTWIEVTFPQTQSQAIA